MWTYSHDGAEDLLGHGDGLWVLGEDDGGLDKVSLGSIRYGFVSFGKIRVPKERDTPTVTTGNHLATCLLGLLDDTRDPLECRLVDDGTSKVLPFGTWANGNGVDLFDERVSESSLPERLGDVTTCESGTLLTRVLECCSDGLDDTRLDIGRWVIQVEVLSAYTPSALVLYLLCKYRY